MGLWNNWQIRKLEVQIREGERIVEAMDGRQAEYEREKAQAENTGAPPPAPPDQPLEEQVRVRALIQPGGLPGRLRRGYRHWRHKR